MPKILGSVTFRQTDGMAHLHFIFDDDDDDDKVAFDSYRYFQAYHVRQFSYF